MQPAQLSLTFFERFEADILSGAKTITLRDEAESYYQVGAIYPVSTFEQGRWFCDVKILSVTPVAFDDLNEQHAHQENMTLDSLKAVIREIYPGIDSLFEIQYLLV